MSDVYMIEIDDRSIGLVSRDVATDLYRFHAALPDLFEIDGHMFATPDSARRQARQILGVKTRRIEDLDYAA